MSFNLTSKNFTLLCVIAVIYSIAISIISSVCQVSMMISKIWFLSQGANFFMKCFPSLSSHKNHLWYLQKKCSYLVSLSGDCDSVRWDLELIFYFIFYFLLIFYFSRIRPFFLYVLWPDSNKGLFGHDPHQAQQMTYRWAPNP